VSQCGCFGRAYSQVLHGEASSVLAERPWYVFDLSDEMQWLEQLRGHGFDLLWDAIGHRFGAIRDEPETLSPVPS